MEKHCEDCGKSEKSQGLIDSPNEVNEHLCYDCARLQGICLSCGKDIRLLVYDYFNYDDDVCPECSEKNK